MSLLIDYSLSKNYLLTVLIVVGVALDGSL
jgi:hypothetical protein